MPNIFLKIAISGNFHHETLEDFIGDVFRLRIKHKHISIPSILINPCFGTFVEADDAVFNFISSFLLTAVVFSSEFSLTSFHV